MNECSQALLKYFQAELPNLHKSYQWKIPKIGGFHLSGERGYGPNVELKKFFNQKWRESSRDERIALAKTVVADWGGVKGNKAQTLQSYVYELEKENPALPLKGIASYSKIYSIADLDKYAIYDARVAACLNAVQWNCALGNGVAFNYISGRNKFTGDVVNKRGFACLEAFKVRALKEKGWACVPRAQTYAVYLDLLKTCLKSLPSNNLYDLEMVLFSNAEKECRKAMKIEEKSGV